MVLTKYANLHCKKFDIISDLHIDQWSKKYNNKYPCGEIKEAPFKFPDKTGDYLIIAGDISDNLQLSIDYMVEISKFYKKVLFVDGNHEHVIKYPNLYSYDEINKKIKETKNDKLIYLCKESYIIDDTVFIGKSGWWNYNDNDTDSIEINKKYFDNWISSFTVQDNLTFIDNVTKKSLSDFESLKTEIEKYQKIDAIKNIVIVTHTLPHNKYCDHTNDYLSFATEVNTKFSELFDYDKLNYWIFGHTHKISNDNFRNINFICNPRGRPEDFNRVIYNIKTILI